MLKRICNGIQAITLGLLLSFPATTARQFNPIGSALPSPEEMEKLGLTQDDMAALQELQKQVAQLSEEEKAQLQKAVEETVEKISTMSDDELKKFADELDTAKSEEDFEKIFGQYFDAPEIKPTPAAPTVKPKPTEKKVSKPKALVATTKQQTLINNINSILRSTDAFLIKMACFQDVCHKIDTWAQKNKIHMAGRSWASLQTEINAFAQLLRKAISQEMKSSEYKFVDELLKEESFINAVQKIASTLAALEGKVQEASPLDIAPLTKESKQAIRQVISQYIEALTVLKLPDALIKAIAAYEPKAQEIAEYEAQMKKVALEESKRPRYAGRVITAGKEPEAPARVKYPDVGLGRPGAGFSGSRSGNLGRMPSSSYGGSAPLSSQGGTSGAGRAAAADPRAAQKAPGQAEQKEKAEAARKAELAAKGKPAEPTKARGIDGRPAVQPTDQKPGEAQPGAPAAPQLDNFLQTQVGTVEKALSEIDTLVGKSKPLRGIKATLTSADPVDPNFAEEELKKVSTQVTKIHTAVSDAYKYAHAEASTLDATQRKMVQGGFAQTLQKHGTANLIPKQLKDLEKEILSISPEKQYAYLGLPEQTVIGSATMQLVHKKLPKSEQETFAKAIADQNQEQMFTSILKTPKLDATAVSAAKKHLAKKELNEAQAVLMKAIQAAYGAELKKISDELVKLQNALSRTPGSPSRTGLASTGETLKEIEKIVKTFDKSPEDLKKEEAAKKKKAEVASKKK